MGEKGVSPNVLRRSTRSVSRGTEVTLVTEYDFTPKKNGHLQLDACLIGSIFHCMFAKNK